MWLFLPQGFISIVAHRDMKNSVLVRARCAKHLSDLFPGTAQTVLPDADYRYRIIITRSELNDFISNHISDMRYDNFKAAIDDDFYHDTCLNIWHHMWQFGKISEVRE